MGKEHCPIVPLAFPTAILDPSRLGNRGDVMKIAPHRGVRYTLGVQGERLHRAANPVKKPG